MYEQGFLEEEALMGSSLIDNCPTWSALGPGGVC